MSVAPHSGIIDFGTFTPPDAPKDGIQGEVPAPLLAEIGYILSTNGWIPGGGGSGTVTDVTATAPVVSSGGATPNISMAAATTSANGYLTSADWNTFNSKQPAGTYVTSVAATSPVTSTGGATPTISMPAATTSVSGYLTNTDWTTFNNKGSVSSVSGTGTVSGLSLSGTVTTTGSLTLGGALNLSSPPVIGASTPNSATFTSAALTTGTIATPPVNNNDIVNKQYVDALSSGIHFHEAVGLATTTALPANTYNNGASGVGATLTGNANGALSVDSTLTFVAERVLVKNEAAGANNGVYVVTQVGSAGTPYILTRASDFDTVGNNVDQIDEGDFFLVTGGVLNLNTAFVQQTPPPITVGTTAIVFQQFAAPITYTAGTGLSESPSFTFNIANTGTAGTYGSATLIPVITTNAQGQVTNVTTAANPQGTVTSVTGTAPVVSSGGNSPAISMAAATTSVNGYLTSTDWNTFNGKQAALVSGTSIKTVNSNSLLGSGNVAVQDVLVSATNIKTINGTSVLGSGDLVVSGSFAGGTLTSPLILAAGTATNGTEPLRFQTGVIATSPAAGTMEYDGVTLMATPQSGNRGVVPAVHYITQVANYTTPTGTANTLKQMFNATTSGSMTAAANTSYFFECMFNLSSMSATSGNFQFGLLGTATVTNIMYMAIANKTALTVQTASSHTLGTVKTAVVITANNTTTTGYALIKGKIVVSTAGTIIPAFATSIAAASVVNAGAYFKIYTVGTNTEVEIGNWV